MTPPRSRPPADRAPTGRPPVSSEIAALARFLSLPSLPQLPGGGRPRVIPVVSMADAGEKSMRRRSR
ncbi:hypothetical protein AB0I91_43865 [Actinosynnema sp. NPDC049800]